MSLLRGKEKSREGLTGGQERLASQAAERILRFHHKLASYLNSKTSGLSVRTWRVLLGVFCLLFGAYCLWLLVQVF